MNRTETTTFFGMSHLPSTSRPPKTTTLPPTAAAECISLGRGIDPVPRGTSTRHSPCQRSRSRSGEHPSRLPRRRTAIERSREEGGGDGEMAIGQRISLERPTSRSNFRLTRHLSFILTQEWECLGGGLPPLTSTRVSVIVPRSTLRTSLKRAPVRGSCPAKTYMCWPTATQEQPVRVAHPPPPCTESDTFCQATDSPSTRHLRTSSKT